ncbi:MAG TPA: hypothetical protein VF731_00880 [Solirubrobacterales bacterium]
MKAPDQTPQPILPPAWWWVAAVLCWALTLAAFVASALNTDMGLVILGIPGSLGLFGLGLWMKRNRFRRKT